MKYITFLLLIITTLYLSSCLFITPRYLHAPNSANLLQVEKNKDIKASLSYTKTAHEHLKGGGSKQQSSGLDIQAAFALSNKIAIKLDVFTKSENDKDDLKKEIIDNYSINYKRKGIELSVGYYKYFGKKKNISFNIYTGLGFGNNSFDGIFRNDSMINRTYSSNYTKWFLIPSIRLIGTKNYSLLLAYRLSVMKFNTINTNDEELKKGFYNDLTSKNSVFGDVAFDNQFGFNKIKGIKFHFMIGSAKLYTYFTKSEVNINGSTYSSDQYLYNSAFGSFGVIVDIRKLFEKK
jgi:hypothetical protein